MTIQIETNHNMGDIVFFLNDDKIKCGAIYKMEITLDENGQRSYLFVRDANNDISVVPEERVFPSKEQLIQSL
jgi:hypothetical protein